MKRFFGIVPIVVLLLATVVFGQSQQPLYASSSGICSGKNDTRWLNSSAVDLDGQILGVKIVAYRVQWFNGVWSSWYVPGVNDDYQKSGENLRRVWACFNDHTHEYMYVPMGASGLRSYSEFDDGQMSSNIPTSGVVSKTGTPHTNQLLTSATSSNIDKVIFRDVLVAYRVTQSDETVSGWMIPGYGDLFQPAGSTLRRGWSYFNQYNYEYLSYPIVIRGIGTTNTTATFKVNCSTPGSYQYSISAATGTPVITTLSSNPGIVSGLVAGTSYQCKAKINYDGYWSDEFPVINFITTTSKPANPQVSLITDVGFTVTCATAAERYRFELTNTSTGVITNYETVTKPLPITSLPPFTKYNIRVLTSVNSIWAASWSNSVTATTKPSVPVVNGVNGDYVKIRSVDAAEQYCFQVTNIQTGKISTVYSIKNFTVLYDLTLNQSYKVNVKIYRNGVWSVVSNFVNFSTASGSAILHHATSMYTSKGGFLVSDADWRAVMTLVPLSTWTTKNTTELNTCNRPYSVSDPVCAYPVLIYHEENGVADLDPIINFLKQYGASTLYYSGTPPTGLGTALSGVCSSQPAASYLSYWNNTDVVVVSENNYTTALSAATYASLLGAPLLIDGYNSAIDLSGKWVIGVGTPAISCDEMVSVASVRSRYMAATNTTKMMIVAPADLSVYNTAQNGSYIPCEWTTGNFFNLYRNMSLAAPFLASAKRELLVAYTDTSKNYAVIDTFIRNSVLTYPEGTIQYLTLYAAPTIIPQARFGDYFMPGSSYNVYSQLDGALYADLNDDYYQDIRVGRIYANTSSDVSSYNARVLFYNKMTKSQSFATLQTFENNSTHAKANYVRSLFSALGFTDGSSIAQYGGYFNTAAYKDKAYIFYDGHGGYTGCTNGFSTFTLRSDKIWLNSTLFSSSACAIAKYDMYPSNGYLFSAEIIRRGAIGFVGAVENNAENTDVEINFTNFVCNGDDFGTAFMKASQNGVVDCNAAYLYDPFQMLIGDPTFNPGWNANGSTNKLSLSVSTPVSSGAGVQFSTDMVLAASPVYKTLGVFTGNAGFLYDIYETPIYAGPNHSRSLFHILNRYTTSQPGTITCLDAPKQINVRIKIPNPNNMQALTCTAAYCTVNGVTEQIELQRYCIVTKSGTGIIEAQIPLGNNFVFNESTTVLPEAKIHAEFVLVP